MIDLGSKVFYRAGAADGGAVSIAFVTSAAEDEITVGLTVKPDQQPWIDRPAVKLLGSETLQAECWSPWPIA